jgi:hypothetical protein
MSDKSPKEEASILLKKLKEYLPRDLDGKEAILEMKKNGDNQWRQMEWQGFYLEYLVENKLMSDIGGSEGPKYGNTQFDYEKDHPWDFKVHSSIRKNGYSNNVMILNDSKAIRQCIEDKGGIGFIVASGEPEWESDEHEFRAWHYSIQEEKSDYVKEGEKKNRSHRNRKTAFEFENIEAYYFGSVDIINKGLSEGWIGEFQKGMRNSDGSSRNKKYKIYTNKVPDEYKIENALFNR